ncbi:MAG TPA: hypothetical protein VFV50_03335, partial [Bdellovibrionales bacterium]|nr:hypothetical protein [Bdellovibrionales bacterium]
LRQSVPAAKYSPTLFVTAWSLNQIAQNSTDSLARPNLGQLNGDFAHDEGTLIDLWERYFKLGWSLMKEHDVPYFVFIQPNPHLTEMKPLTDSERARLAEAPEWVKTITIRYPALLERVAKIKRETGAPVYNLVDAFKNVKEEIYADACCHLNEPAGQRLLADAVIAHIAAAPSRRFDRVKKSLASR